jgi:hypothetical protein
MHVNDGRGSPESTQLLRERTRMAWRLALVALVLGVILGSIAYQRGQVFGLRLNTAWRTPLTSALFGMLVYKIVSALRSGRVLSNGSLIERSVNPRQFYLHLVLLGVIATVVIAVTVFSVYFDLVGLKGR